MYPTPDPVQAPFLDLSPGWRVTVITPVTKSGKFTVQVSSNTSSGDSHSMSAPDLIGYETSRYQVQRLDGDGVRFRLDTVEITVNGETRPAKQPLMNLFDLPRAMKYVRLIFLIRVSNADHDMAIVGAEDKQGLEAATADILRSPVSGCNIGAVVACRWVPTGIAVRPEKRRDIDGKAEWVPVL